MSITLNDNEFFTGLANMAVMSRLYATNNSNTPEQFVNSFATDTLSNGDTKIFYFADLPSVGDYSEVSSVLTVTKVDTNYETISITDRKIIKSSYSEYILNAAFNSDDGMNQFVGYLLAQMESAKTDYLYNLIVGELFGKTFLGASSNINVDQYPVSNLTLVSEINEADLFNQKKIALALQNTIDNISVYTTNYNGLGYKQALDVKDMRFVFCNPYKNKSIIDLYATLLNSEQINKAYAKPEMLTIPQSAVPVGDEDVIGFLLHKFTYQFFYKFVFMGTFFDESNLCVNNFLHFWIGKGFLDNLPAAKFTAVDLVLPE